MALKKQGSSALLPIVLRLPSTPASGLSSKTIVSVSSPLDTLRKTQQLLQMIHHRSKNQHRHSHWYRQFNVLRRALFKMVEDGERWQQARPRERVKLQESGWCSSVRAREEWLRRLVGSDEVGTKVWTSFSNLVADNQFAPLGVVLVAVLARLNRTLGPCAEQSVRGSSSNNDSQTKEANNGEDVGQTVSRDEFGRKSAEVESTPLAAAADAKKRKAVPAPAPPPPAQTRDGRADPPRKKRKKKTSAIDDIFAGL